MGPMEKVFRSMVEDEVAVQRMEQRSGIRRTNPRFVMAGICALTEMYGEFRDGAAGVVSEEEAQDYLNALYVILGAHAVAVAEQT